VGAGAFAGCNALTPAIRADIVSRFGEGPFWEWSE